MESDDRVTGVIKLLDDALGDLERMDLLIGLYKTQLNVSSLSLIFEPSLIDSLTSSRYVKARYGRYRTYRISKSWIASSNFESTSSTF